MYVWTLQYVANEDPSTNSWADAFATREECVAEATQFEADVDLPAPTFEPEGRSEVATVEGGTYRLYRTVV